MIPSLESLRQTAFRAIVGSDERMPETQSGVCEEMPEQTEQKTIGENRRFDEWCCYAVWRVEQVQAVASNDSRFFVLDFNGTSGTCRALLRCNDESIELRRYYLRKYHPPSWEAFKHGEWPPCTPGFGPSELDQLAAGMNETDRAILLEIARTLKDGKIDNEYLSGSVYVALQAARNKARAKNDKRAPRVPRKHGECLAAVLSTVDSEPRSAAELAKRCGLTRKATYATLERLVEKEKVRVTQGRWPKYWRTV